MEHSFDVMLAQKYGVNAAVLLKHFEFWIAKNKANGQNYFDGNYWTYNSRKAFAELFPYMNARQIDYALKKLIDDGLIITGNYNKSTYDRTLWYAITKKGYSILQNCEMEVTKLENGFDNIVEPIPDIDTDINTENISHPLPLKNQAKFFEKFPSVVIDSYSPIMQELTEEDWGTITEQFEKSEWLRVNIKTLSQLLRIVKKILAGSYAPFEQVKRYETAEEAEKRRKEEERQKRLDYFNSLPGFKWE